MTRYCMGVLQPIGISCSSQDPCAGLTIFLAGATSELIPVLNGMNTTLLCEENAPIGTPALVSPSPLVKLQALYLDTN